MGLFIGNMNYQYLPPYIKDINYNDYKVYGVTFNGDISEGIRLYSAEGLRFIPSSNSVEEVDDFYSIVDSPFHTRKCIRQYINGEAIYTFEDTDPAEYKSLKDSKTGARMIAFPKFYYKRPNEWTFLVSSEMVPGFEISPAHCKRETIGGPLMVYDYVYVSEFMYNTQNQVSQPNYGPRVNTTMNTFRQLAKNEGMYVEDLSIRMMITILAIIKYANLNSQDFLGNGHSSGNNTAIQYDDIKGHDGYRTSKTDNTSIKVLDLVDFYANAWEFIEGCCTFNRTIYINNDTKTIVDYPNKTNYKTLGWENTGMTVPYGQNAAFTNITYNTDYDYLMAPQSVSGRPNPFGDGYWQYDSADGYLLIFGGSGWDGASDGLFSWSSCNAFSVSNVVFGARFVAFGASSGLL